MSTLRVTEIQSNSTAFNTPVLFETSGGVENGKLAKAWVNFNGQGTVAVRNDFNVNTITDYGIGRYGVNFSNAMPNTNYSCLATSTWGAALWWNATAHTSSQTTITTIRTDSGAVQDHEFTCVTVFS